MYSDYVHHMGMGIWWWLLLSIAFAVLIFFLVKRNDKNENPRKILDARLARGEISKEEYEELKSLLNKK